MGRPGLIFLVILLPAASLCQPDRDTLIVAINPITPSVMINGDVITGFDIDLWETIAEDLHLPFRYQEVEFERIFEELSSGRVDVALAAITINIERESIVDFSHSYFDTGLRILVPAKTRTDLKGSFKAFLNPGLIHGIMILVLFIILCGHVLWWSERGSDAINDKYVPGIFESFWCVITTMTTVGYGDIAPRKWLGRTAAFIMMLTGIGLFGWIVGEFAALTTVRSLAAGISSPEDLRGKVVATAEATTSVKTVRDLGAKVIETKKIEQAYNLLLNGEVDAVVYDSPTLMYYAKNEGMGKVGFAGDLFERQAYGIAFPEGSRLREKVNRSLLKLREKRFGESLYDMIYQRWFGDYEER